MEDQQDFTISDEELQAVEESAMPEVISIDLTDLIGQTETVGPGPKGSINWTPGARPSKQPVDIVLCIDTSGSMAATDYRPDRLQAAKDAAKLFATRKVTQNYNDRVGVIGFGGSARVVHPLDSRLEKVAAAIDQLTITHSGTMIGRALQQAHQELGRYNSQRRAIVLLSDGGDQYDRSQPLKVAQNLKGVKVFTIGMGTTKGSMVKIPAIGTVRVTLNEQLLKQIAQATGGKYMLAPDVPQLQEIYLGLADY